MRRQRGFTLIELLTAAAIFAMISGMLFQMVRNGLDVWRIGEGNRESLEKGSTLIHEIATELRMIHAASPPGDPDATVRMIADYGLYDFDEDQRDETLVQRLRFVRSCPEERYDPRIRQAGDLRDAAEREAGVRPRAPSGLAEVAFTTVRLPVKKQEPSLLQLVRTFRTPIAGADSIFQPKQFESPQRILRDGIVLADNVLYLGFEFWSRDTESWEDPWNSETGPLTTWDSTRGTLLEKDTFNEFRLAKGEESVLDGSDDIFPRRIRITLVVEKDVDEATPARLKAPLAATDDRIRVDRPDLIQSDSPHPFVKIDGEWMRYTAKSGEELKVVRAERGSAKLQHVDGARVHLGRTYQRTVEIPVFREDWNDK